MYPMSKSLTTFTTYLYISSISRRPSNRKTSGKIKQELRTKLNKQSDKWWDLGFTFVPRDMFVPVSIDYGH